VAEPVGEIAGDGVVIGGNERPGPSGNPGFRMCRYRTCKETPGSAGVKLVRPVGEETAWSVGEVVGVYVPPQLPAVVGVPAQSVALTGFGS
jgi:hypothetical protein